MPFGGKEHRFLKNAWANANKGYVFIDWISTWRYAYSVLDTGLITRKSGGARPMKWAGQMHCWGRQPSESLKLYVWEEDK